MYPIALSKEYQMAKRTAERKVELLVIVDVPEDTEGFTDAAMARIVDRLIKSGLSDAQRTVELDDKNEPDFEDNTLLADAAMALEINIHEPILLEDKDKGLRGSPY